MDVCFVKRVSLGSFCYTLGLRVDDFVFEEGCGVGGGVGGKSGGVDYKDGVGGKSGGVGFKDGDGNHKNGHGGRKNDDERAKCIAALTRIIEDEKKKGIGAVRLDYLRNVKR